MELGGFLHRRSSRDEVDEELSVTRNNTNSMDAVWDHNRHGVEMSERVEEGSGASSGNATIYLY